MSQYRFLNRRHINQQKWDACIQKATNFPYPLYWFLDIVTDKQWSALVLRDYEAVFPVVWNVKFGLRYVYQPFFCQQLGMFAVEPHPQFESTCLRFLQRKFIFSELNIHYDSVAESSALFSLRNNFVLKLSDSYEVLQSSFSKNTQRNLAKAKQHSLIVKPYRDISSFVKMYSATSGANTKGYNIKHQIILEKLVTECLQNGFGELNAAYREHDNEPLAISFAVFSGNRIINLAPVTPKEHRDAGGMSFLLNDYIERFAQTDKVLDFEGSMVESIARFYKGFGAKSQPFWQYRHNLWHVIKQPFMFTPNHYK